MRFRLGLRAVAMVCSALALGGCVSTTTSERDVGVPSSSFREDLLPGPPVLEAVLSRNGSALEIELSRVRSCRRVEITRVRRERVEQSKLSAGTAIGASAVMVVGVATMSAAVFVVGGAIIGVGLLQTGTTTTELPEEQTDGPGTRVSCQRAPAPGVVVQVTRGDLHYQGTSDARGRVEIADVEPGSLRVMVDGEPVRARKGKPRAATRKLEPPLQVEATAPELEATSQEQTPPKPTPKPTPPKPTNPTKPTPPPRPTASKPAHTALPPPPPPPPGVRLFPE